VLDVNSHESTHILYLKHLINSYSLIISAPSALSETQSIFHPQDLCIIHEVSYDHVIQCRYISGHESTASNIK